MANKRIVNLTEQADLANGSYVMIDDESVGSKKYKLKKIMDAVGTKLDGPTDTTLAVSGKAADAKKVGDEISDLKADLSDEIIRSYVTDDIDTTSNGFTVKTSENDKLMIYGTANAARNVGFINGNNFIKTSSASFTKTLDPGKYLIESDMTGAQTLYTIRATYTTFANQFTIVNAEQKSAIVTFTEPVMIALVTISDRNYGTSENPSYISLTIKEIVPKASDGWLRSVDRDTSSETGKTDMTASIMAMLNSTGYCHLGEGIFYVSGNIDMPEGSRLCGCGEASEIRLLSSVASGYAIKMEKFCTISNIKLSGSYSSISVSTEGTRTGILFSANNDGSEGATAYDSELCMIDNVWIENFSGSGIKCHNSSMNIRKGLYATNVRIVSCYVGINIDYISEFNKFTNICVSACRYGCVNNGGNNVFTACTFHATLIGFYIDGTQPNAAHGTINGCTFCHVGSNDGVAFKADDVASGFIVANSQFWYNSIELTNCQGVLFDGCMFGRGVDSDSPSSCATIAITGGNLALFSGCMFHLDATRPPKITITNNTKTVFSGCYGTESGLPITAS